jgi:hypothetical protein
VVVAAGADPVAVTVAAKINSDHVRAQERRDLVPAVREIEKAVDEYVRGVAWGVPLEYVIGQACRERDAA